MDLFLQQLVNGLSLGGIYALIALGYTMIYGIIELINFAHGDVYTLGTFFSLAILTPDLGARRPLIPPRRAPRPSPGDGRSSHGGGGGVRWPE